MGDSKDNSLWMSWKDSGWISANLNPTNIMDYFQNSSNPFYDRTCNNENVKMQRLSMEHLSNMVGIEYMLLHVQEPVLYVIRKQHRHSATVVTPMSDYYIIDGTIYQAPDLGSVVNSRILSAVNHLQASFDEARLFSRYHPSKGYWWEFNKEAESKDPEEEAKKAKKKTTDKAKEETGSAFQRQRVNYLLEELVKKFPFKALPLPAAPVGQQTQSDQRSAIEEPTPQKEIKVEIKVEPGSKEAPPAKKPRLA